MKGNNPPIAFEELSPNSFVVHDIRVTQFLHGEGELVGNRFTLTSWRREGLFARIRQRGLIMASLDDQIAELPRLPHAPHIGESHWHPLGTPQTRWSMYAPHQRTLAPLATIMLNERAGVMIPLGAVVRRRHGRGIPEWFGCHTLKGNQLDLVALTEDQALLYGLSQAARVASPLPWERINTFAYLAIPQLPRPHLQLLGRLARFDQERQMWSTEITHLTFMSQFLQRVGITLTPTVPPVRLSRKG